MRVNKTTLVFEGTEQNSDLALKGIIEIIRANGCVITSVYDNSNKKR